jgi:hypothetical protein
MASEEQRKAWTVREDLDIRDLEDGMRVLTSGNAVAEVVSNPHDGMWVFVRYLEVPEDPGKVGAEELVLWEDFRGVIVED